MKRLPWANLRQSGAADLDPVSPAGLTRGSTFLRAMTAERPSLQSENALVFLTVVECRRTLAGEDEMMLVRLAAPLLAILVALAAAPAIAQDYPNHPVTIVVPFAAGGGTDIVARMVAAKLEQRLGKSFLIENKAGAGSTTGAAFAAK